MLTRYRNYFVHLINKQAKLPKLVVIVVEDDIINEYYDAKADFKAIYNCALSWIMREMDRTADSARDIMPNKAKNDKYPRFLWIVPTLHKNYRNNHLRKIFNECLTTRAKLFKNVSACKLKQLWNYDDGSLYYYDEGRFTAQGFATYWSAVDRTIRFCDFTMNASQNRKWANLQQNGQKPVQGQKTGFKKHGGTLNYQMGANEGGQTSSYRETGRKLPPAPPRQTTKFDRHQSSSEEEDDDF